MGHIFRVLHCRVCCAATLARAYSGRVTLLVAQKSKLPRRRGQGRATILVPFIRYFHGLRADHASPGDLRVSFLDRFSINQEVQVAFLISLVSGWPSPFRTFSLHLPPPNDRVSKYVSRPKPPPTSSTSMPYSRLASLHGPCCPTWHSFSP